MKYLSNIIASGSRRIKRTKQYQEQRQNIRMEKTIEYRSLISNGKNLFVKFALQVRREIEIRKAINKLDSLEKMYLSR